MTKKSEYYAHPDGEDAFGKVVAINKYALGAGLAWSTADVLMISRTQGYLPTIARYISVTGPFVAVATAFTMGTHIMTNLRKKDDKINYAIGGYCAGAALAAIKKSGPTVLVAGSFMAIAGVLKKMSIEEGWEFFPELVKCTSTARPHDYTIMAERERNWTTGKD